MPIYEYRCEECGGLTEMLQRLDEPPLAECPDCGGTVKKLISAPAFQFKGSGWYVTDYAGKGSDGTEKDGAAGGGGGASSSAAEAPAGNASGAGDSGGTASSSSAEGQPASKGASGSGSPGGSRTEKKGT